MRSIRKFGNDDAGAAAAEFAIVLPVLTLLLFGIVQYGVMFFAYNNMHNAAREAARMLAVGELDETAAEAQATDQLVGWIEGPATVVAENATTTGTEFVRVEITVPGADASILAFAPGPATLRAEVFMREE